MKKTKTKKQTKGREELRKTMCELWDDINFLQYIITASHQHEDKQDLMFTLHSNLSERAKTLAELYWQKEKI
jgi:hypothetical protein